MSVLVGLNGLLKIFNVDRDRITACRVLKVAEAVMPDGLHRLGTENDSLERQYSRKEFTTADSTFINTQDEKPSTTLKLIKVLALNSGSEQGFVSERDIV